ncbi:MAG: C40 family peptidase [Chlamydiia bacterium]|nr:C40 family peptidase [Chlamydiia bacterium]
MHRIGVEVTDLRREPITSGQVYEMDRLQETQLLYGEPVQILDQREGWFFVAASAQPRHFQGAWQPYCGWVEQQHVIEADPALSFDVVTEFECAVKNSAGAILLRLSVGSYLPVLGRSDERWHVRLLDGREGWVQPQRKVDPLRVSHNWLGSPYHWGGCSAYHPDLRPLRGVDCSALVHLSYRAAGRTIPRDAHDQYLACNMQVSVDQLARGDLVFLAPKAKPGRMDHVMLYLGDGVLLESTLASNSVRKIALQERLSDAFTVTCARFV